MISTFRSGGLASRQSRRGIRHSYVASAAITLLALLAVGAFTWVGLSSAAGEVMPSVAIPNNPFASSCPCPVGSAVNFPVGIFPASVAVGDFNRDGIADLASATGGTDDVSIVLGDGSGGFGAATSFSVGTSPSW